jgi:Fe2+ transport system protein FeoA
MLHYLTTQDISIGEQLQMIARQPFDGPTEIRIGNRTHNLGSNLARAIHVEPT